MKIFISATTSGLASYREAVARKLRKLRHVPVFQEEFEVVDQSVSRMLQMKMRICDAVICLVGPAYGCAYPFSEPGKPSLSYTQYEHELARSLGKTVYVFLAKPDAELDEAKEQPLDDAQAQEQFIKRLQSEGRATGLMFRFYKNKEDVLSMLDECISDAGQRSEQNLKAYPLPLVRIWDDFRGATDGSQRAQDFDDIAGGLLSFVALAAVQHSTHSGGRVVVPMVVDEGCEWLMSRWWRVIKESLASGVGFMLELPTWAEQQEENVRTLEGTLEKLSARRLSAGENDLLSAQAKEIITQIFASLVWLKGYVLAGVSFGSDPAVANVRLLRGGDAMPPRRLTAGGGFLSVKGERLYLFSLRTRTALDLWPSLWCLASEHPLQPVYTGTWFGNETQCGIRLEALGPSGAPDGSVWAGSADLPWDELPASWLRTDPVRPLVPGEHSGSVAVGVVELLDQLGWEELDRMCRAEEEREVLLGGHYALAQKPLQTRTGARTELFEAVKLSQAEVAGDSPEHCVAIMLPDALRRDPVARADLCLRHECWGRLRHFAVVKPLPESGTASDAERPFILLPFLDEHASLDRWVHDPAQAGLDALSPRDVLAMATIAAELFRDAHEQGLRLLWLPLRHALSERKAPNLVRFIGFETLCPAESQEESPLDRAKRCSRDGRFAPELKRIRNHIPATVDVFALGMFIEALQGREGRPMDRFKGAVHDQMACLTYHCLAVEPGRRFQTPGQILEFLDLWVNRPPCSPPPVVEIPDGCTWLNGFRTPVRTFQISKYPITTWEYECFRAETDHRPPRNHAENESGPWCPVSGVSYEDAQAFCEWLSRREGSWRLPTEAEWLRAAALDEPRRYPWGEAPPDRGRANYERLFDGLSVVGSCDQGISPAGCHDMAGNVWEWCADFMSPSEPWRVLKGGAYDFSEDDLTLATRRGVVCAHRSRHVGFRVVRERD